MWGNDFASKFSYIYDRFVFDLKIAKEKTKRAYSYTKMRKYLDLKFQGLLVLLRAMKANTLQYFFFIFGLVFSSFASKSLAFFNIRSVKILFSTKLNKHLRLARKVGDFCIRGITEKYGLNYILVLLRQALLRYKDISGFQIILSGRFFRRGRALYNIQQFGERGSRKHFRDKSFIYEQSAYIGILGLCSAKVWLFFRSQTRLYKFRPLRFINKNVLDIYSNNNKQFIKKIGSERYARS
jgi:hypothetical protein